MSILVISGGVAAGARACTKLLCTYQHDSIPLRTVAAEGLFGIGRDAAYRGQPYTRNRWREGRNRSLLAQEDNRKTHKTCLGLCSMDSDAGQKGGLYFRRNGLGSIGESGSCVWPLRNIYPCLSSEAGEFSC